MGNFYFLIFSGLLWCKSCYLAAGLASFSFILLPKPSRSENIGNYLAGISTKRLVSVSRASDHIILEQGANLSAKHNPAVGQGRENARGKMPEEHFSRLKDPRTRASYMLVNITRWYER